MPTAAIELRELARTRVEVLPAKTENPGRKERPSATFCRVSNGKGDGTRNIGTIRGRVEFAVRLDQLGTGDQKFMSVRVGVKEEAANVGGINIFGSRFGNYPQDILMRMRFRD
jgi:hypothetical protein